jgi:DNA-binding beta-propeller fold protein YncE
MFVRGIFISVIGLTILFASCTEDGDGSESPKLLPRTGVFVCNEGNFTFGNASLSFYNTDSNTVQNQMFQNNNGFPLGDVVQSMAIKDSLGFLVINNSGKIFVINTHNFKHTATISGLTSPRYIHFINASKAYVSELYSKSISVVNPVTYSATGFVPVGSSTEQMVQLGDFVYVTSWYRNNKIYKINTLTDELIDSLEVHKQPNSLQLDKNNNLWVLCDGGYLGIEGEKDSAALFNIDPNQLIIEKKFTFPVFEASPSELQLNGTRDTLFFMSGDWGGTQNDNTRGVYKMDVGAEALPEEPLITENDRSFYGLGIDPDNSEIYVSDAIDYQQNGWVFRYSSTGVLIDSFMTGIIPGAFAFKK